MRSAASFAVVIFAFVVGCNDEGDETTPIVVEPPPQDCSPGEWRRDDGVCILAGLPPDMPCPPAEWLRDGVCIPAGVPPDGCGPGFVHDGDRGCNAILPSMPCDIGFMAVPGDRRCREVAPCAPGTWGDIPVEPDTEYVDDSYAGMDSDGSALKPWTNIQAAIDVAASGAIIAIAAGSYAEDLVVDSAVRLWGVCPSQVEVEGTGAEAAAVQISAAGTELHGLAVSGGARGVQSLGALAVLLERVWVHDNAGRGINVESAYGPSSVTIRDSLVEHNHEVGVVIAGAEATVERSVMRTTQPDAQGLLGRALNVQPYQSIGAKLSLVASLVEHSHELGVAISGSEATVKGSVIRAASGPGLGGLGVIAQTGTATGERSVLLLDTSLVEHSRGEGVFVLGSEATVEASVVRDTQPNAQGLFGRGIDVEANLPTDTTSIIRLGRSLIEQSHEVGLAIMGSEAMVEAIAVRDTQPTMQGQVGGHGVSVLAHKTTGAPSTAELRTSLVERSHWSGVFVSGSNATLDACVVRDSQLDAQGLRGRGVEAQPSEATGTPSTLLLSSSLVELSHEVGVLVTGSQATVDSSVVRDIRPDMRSDARGLQAQVNPVTGAPALVLLRASRIEQSQQIGVLVVDGTATIESSVVGDTVPDPLGRLGDGVIVWSYMGSASATITATHIERSARAALASQGARVSISDSAFTCQAIDLDSEVYQGKAALLEDLGDNRCGCPDATQSCKAVSANLAPPAPPTP